MSGTPRIVAMLLYVAGVVLIVAGAFTWYTITEQLADQKIVVASDASCQADQEVNGPFEAYCQALIIGHHALDSTGGKTYAELDREDPARTTAMNASFLQASLFTSVVAFGVAAFAMGVGLLTILTAMAISALNKRTADVRV